MVKLKYKSWDDISIPVYQEIIDIAKGSDTSEDAFTNREVDILAVLCDSDRESLGNLLIDDYAQLVREANFLHKIPYYLPSETFTLQGVVYNIVVDMAKFTLAQYTEYNALRANVNTNVASLLAVLLVPTTAKHYADGYDVADVVKAIEAELPYYKAYGILRFFQVAQSISLANTLSSEARKMKKMARATTDKAERTKLMRQADRLRKASISLGRCWLSR